MDDLENKLNSLNQLYDEAHSLNDEQTVPQEEEGYAVDLSDKNKIGTVKNAYIKRLLPKEGMIVDDAEELVADMDAKQEEEKTNIVNEEDTKLIELPNNLLPNVQKEQKYPLMVQKEQTRALVLTKVGSVVTSILATLVVLTIGVILAIVLR